MAQPGDLTQQIARRAIAGLRHVESGHEKGWMAAPPPSIQAQMRRRILEAVEWVLEEELGESWARHATSAGRRGAATATDARRARSRRLSGCKRWMSRVAGSSSWGIGAISVRPLWSLSRCHRSRLRRSFLHEFLVSFLIRS